MYSWGKSSKFSGCFSGMLRLNLRTIVTNLMRSKSTPWNWSQIPREVRPNLSGSLTKSHETWGKISGEFGRCGNSLGLMLVQHNRQCLKLPFWGTLGTPGILQSPQMQLWCWGQNRTQVMGLHFPYLYYVIGKKHRKVLGTGIGNDPGNWLIWRKAPWGLSQAFNFSGQFFFTWSPPADRSHLFLLVELRKSWGNSRFVSGHNSWHIDPNLMSSQG